MGLPEHSRKVLNDAELVAFEVSHHHDDTLAGIVVSLTSPMTAECFHLMTAVVDVVHLDIEMQTHFGSLSLGDTLERQTRHRIEPRADSRPAGPVVLCGNRPVEQRAPECSQCGRVEAVDRNSAQTVAHILMLARGLPKCRHR